MSSLETVAILGRQPELSLLELEARLGAQAIKSFGLHQAAVMSKAIELTAFGGIQKLARVLYRGPQTSLRSLPIELEALPRRATKTPFGISLYGTRERPQALLAIGLELKKRLKQRGSVRLVVPAQGLALSAAEVTHNRLIEDGFELVVIIAGTEMIIALTTQVQDIAWYTERDRDRPMRSAKVGMLPPKLAQILVNTVSANLVVDPFCGTGVILQEARLLGRSANGSDLASDMVEATRQNMAWLDQQAPVLACPWKVSEADAREVRLPAGCAVVSEGYLGPNMTSIPSPARLEEVRHELRALYTGALKNWAQQLPRGAEVTICVPAWRQKAGWQVLGLESELKKLGYIQRSFKHSPMAMRYARDDQIVGRQILCLKRS